MSSGRLLAVLPVKRFARAKSRLASALSAPERAELAEAMMLDVLSVLMRCKLIDAVTVVTGDEAAAGHARAHGADVLARPEDRGLNDAANAAVEALGTKAAAMLVVPSDVPLIRVGDLTRLILEHGHGPGVTLVPAAVDGGTNAILAEPAGAITYRFGPESCARHIETARRAGLELHVMEVPRIAHDIDRPGDLRRFMHTPSPTRAYRLLDRLGGRRRFAGLVSDDGEVR